MYMLSIVFVFLLFFARFISNYNSKYDEGKYITVKNKVLAKLLIDKESFFRKGVHSPKKDRNKMSIAGFSLYLSIVFIAVLTFVLQLLPKIPCEPFEIDATKLYLYADTLNAKIPIIATMILFCLVFIYSAIGLFKTKKEIEQKWIKVLMIVTSVFMIIVSLAVIVEMVFELIKW